MATTRVQDFYKATITRNWTATTGDFNISVAPTITAGIIVISPNSTTQREIVRYTATGTNQYGPFVTISDVADRGLSGTTAQSHIIGEQVRMNVTAVHWDELLADAVAPTVDVGTTTTLEPGSDATVTNSGDTINATLDFEIPAGSTIYSGTSIPDNSVGRNGDWAFDTSANSYVWYKSGDAWALVNSLKGATGDGNGIASIVKTNTVGLADTYTITYDDETTTTFDITNGAKGDQGDAGISVVSIIKTNTVGLVDTYTITYSNETISTFDVTNGADGTDGIDGISFLWQGVYDNGTAYDPNDAVSYNGSSYMCIAPSTGNLPTDATYWDLMAQRGTDGEGSGDISGSGVENEIAYFTAEKTIDNLPVATYPSLTELSYVKGVTSGIQTQLGNKEITANKVTSFQATPDDTHYPSEKLVKDSLDAKAPLASPTFTGTVTLGDNTRVDLTLPTVDTYVTGNTTDSFASGYSSAVGDLVFFGSGGKWLEVDADAVATCKGLIGIALEAKADTEIMKVALPGSFVRLDSWNWTIGATLYAGETLGAMQETIPTGADAVVKVVGFAVTADVIYFNPSPDQSTVVA